MRALHILYSIERSGLELMLATASDEFRAQGVEVHVLSTGEGEGELAPRFRELGYVVHHLPFRSSIGYLYRLHSFIRQERFDVVHVHTERAFFWFTLTARLAGVSHIVRSVHNTFRFDGLLRLERVLQRSFSRCVLRVKYLAVGPSVAENERQRFFAPCKIANNWVNADACHPISVEQRESLRRRLALPLNALVVVSVGACVPRKDHQMAIKGMALARALAPDLYYLHIGTGPDEAAERVLAQALGLDGGCSFVGPRNDVADLLAASDVFVMTSEMEGVPIAALEAMSCGLPVVATDVPGLRDVVCPGVTGALVKAEPDNVAAGLLCLLEDESVRRLMGARARERVIQQHSVHKGVEAWLAAYAD